jgi:hypothetical protein
MFESFQLGGFFACVGVLVLLGVSLLIAGGFRKSWKMASAGAFCLLGAGLVFMLASWSARMSDETKEQRHQHVAE